MKAKKTTYQNAVSIKFKNRRITVVKQDENYILEFRAAYDNLTEMAASKVLRNKVRLTTIALSSDAVGILVIALSELLTREQNEKRTDTKDL